MAAPEAGLGYGVSQCSSPITKCSFISKVSQALIYTDPQYRPSLPSSLSLSNVFPLPTQHLSISPSTPLSLSLFLAVCSFIASKRMDGSSLLPLVSLSVRLRVCVCVTERVEVGV